MIFRKNCKKGGRGGGHFRSEKFHCKFGAVWSGLRKNRNIFSEKGAGGQGPFRNFPKIHLFSRAERSKSLSFQRLQPVDFNLFEFGEIFICVNTWIECHLYNPIFIFLNISRNYDSQKWYFLGEGLLKEISTEIFGVVAKFEFWIRDVHLLQFNFELGFFRTHLPYTSIFSYYCGDWLFATLPLRLPKNVWHPTLA